MTWQNRQNECAPSEDSDQPVKQFEKMANYKQAYSYLYPLDVCQSRVQGKDTSFNSASNKIRS